MGLYDVVTASAHCPKCGKGGQFRIQYKHGYCRLHEYKVGDAIAWFDAPGRRAPLHDHGENLGGLVRAPGIPEQPCGSCGSTSPGAIIWFQDNVIDQVEVTANELDERVELEQVQAPARWLRVWTARVAGSANEDRLDVSCRGARWTLVVADGAGGMAGGAAAAARAASAAASIGADECLDPHGWCERLGALDRQLADDPKCGETTLVVIQVAGGELFGASVGDSGAVLVAPDRVVDLTVGQVRKPLLGSGQCAPVAIMRRALAGRLLLASDGLFKYVHRTRFAEAALAGIVQNAVEQLVNAARLPSGGLQDDVCIVLAEETGASLNLEER